jgi:hypothetical protein
MMSHHPTSAHPSLTARLQAAGAKGGAERGPVHGGEFLSGITLPLPACFRFVIESHGRTSPTTNQAESPKGRRE